MYNIVITFPGRNSGG